MANAVKKTFEMSSHDLCFDEDKATLLCREKAKNKNLWIKKLEGVADIEGVLEDAERFYIICSQDDENSGYYLAIDKSSGSTHWYIPGKAYFHVLHGQSLYAIFADANIEFFLLKIDRSNGSKCWHHRVGSDLCEYLFGSERILLIYESGKTEAISPLTGSPIRAQRRNERC